MVYASVVSPGSGDERVVALSYKTPNNRSQRGRPPLWEAMRAAVGVKPCLLARGDDGDVGAPTLASEIARAEKGLGFRCVGVALGGWSGGCRGPRARIIERDPWLDPNQPPSERPRVRAFFLCDGVHAPLAKRGPDGKLPLGKSAAYHQWFDRARAGEPCDSCGGSGRTCLDGFFSKCAACRGSGRVYKLLVYITHTYQNTLQIKGKPYLPAHWVARELTGFELAEPESGYIVTREGGLVVRSYASKDYDKLEHEEQQYEVLPEILGELAGAGVFEP